MSGESVYVIQTEKFPRPVLTQLFRDYLRLYEEKRNEPGADDMADPKLIAVNGERLAEQVAQLFDITFEAWAKEVAKNAGNLGYASGIGRPMPIIKVAVGPQDA